MASYQPSPQDEGYSEDPLSGSNISISLPPWLSAMAISERTEYVMSIIAQLPTSEVADIVRRLRPRLYINFFNYLPPEVCLKILAFLDPVSLINTAQASREWMQLALDRRLWEQLYLLEGFRVIKSEIVKFEEEINLDRTRLNEYSSEEHASKKRATPQRILPSLHTDGDSEMTDADSIQKQPSIFGPLTGSRLVKEPTQDLDVAMVSPRSPSSSQSKSTSAQGRSIDPHQSRRGYRIPSGSTLSRFSPAMTKSSLVVLDGSDNKKRLNWQFLYSQRRRLESNWEAEKYTNFQLPHPKHPEEAHEECIYTIQHAGKYLVSGSRDQTLRIWDLDTQRLVRAPLRAHEGSVLCLQFDADPEEDLIVSGSSDATIILWKFSTGQILQRLRRAHRESVLNVRFDKRVLVTCSKDKSIKIFNRRPLNAGDVGYPDYPGGVSPVPTFLNNYGFNPTPTVGLPVMAPYSMIGCLGGHGAAVNAVQIFGDEVVSASGDRTVKVWNWPAQTCTRTLIGHTKGIACVQYDGRRIVSGSSDNEVKVFDKESGLEVASLRAHSNLVRTVQAGFGDLPYSMEEDMEDARNIDYEYFRAVDTGILSQTAFLARGRPRNAGSRKPEDITAYGAKLPPGGGGGRFGRIVSGSYDETIIIWRRDKEGVWRAQHTLRQEEAAQIAARAAHQAKSNESTISQASQSSSSQDQPSNPLTDSDLPVVPFAPGSTAFYHVLIDMTIPQGAAALGGVLRDHPQLLDLPYLGQVIDAQPQAARQSLNSVIQSVVHSQQHLQLQDTSLVQPPQTQSTTPNNTTLNASISQPPLHSGASQTAIQPAVGLPPTQTNLPAAPNPQPNQPHTNHHIPSNMARVFKLQFDARRIICCSQTSVIVGWDFANNDEQLIDSSRFFAPIE